jgi:hypothetical protein
VRNKILSNNQLDGESIDHYVIIRRMIVSELLEQFKAAINNKHSIIAQSLLALLQWDADVENFFSETLWDLLIKYKLENEINFFVKYCGWEEVSHKLLKAFQKLNSEWNPVFRVAVCSLINRSCCNHLLGMLNNNVAVDECYRWILMLEKQFQYQFVFDDLMVSAIIGMGDVGLAFIAYYINNETPSRNIKAFILERIIMMNGPNVWQYMLEQCPFFSHLIKNRTCTVFDNIRNLNINHQIDFFKWILEVEGVNRNIYLKHAVEKRCLEGLIKCLNWDLNN